ncbi:MAG: SsrA-binding protein SmpB [Planctomycetes bacterium]|nr:SsrA-binding protein SmpB [Planctomycetota bacterium]
MAKNKKKAASSRSTGSDPLGATKIIAENRKARHRFEVLDSLECGIALLGSEVKSARDGKVSLDESYARVRSGEVWLIGSDIAEYRQATFWNHEPKRPRKLLLHRGEIRKFAGQAHDKGLTLIPLRMYFNAQGRAKVVLGLCRGRKLHDKREVLKKSETKRELARAYRRDR